MPSSIRLTIYLNKMSFYELLKQISSLMWKKIRL